MDITLVILAAGLGTRFGGGSMKQLQPIDDTGHIIMDYSIHDAILAGFTRIVFIIRKEIEPAFRAAIGSRIELICAENGVRVEYIFQEISDLPEGCVLPKGRTKPWGTGHALFAARKTLFSGPFAIINADDYYGKRAFQEVHDCLALGKEQCCMAGYILKNTLSEHGTVSRGICEEQEGYLTDITEVKAIGRTEDGGIATQGIPLDPDAVASMNMFGFTPAFLPVLEFCFSRFMRHDMYMAPLTCEHILPVLIGQLVRQQALKVRVLPVDSTWYGMTYREDVPMVCEAFAKMIDRGIYSRDLFCDLSPR